VDFLIVFVIYILITLFQMAFIFPLPFSDTGTVRYNSLPWMTFALIIVNSMIFMAWQAPELYQAQTLNEVEPYVRKIWLYGYRGVFLREGQSIGAFATFTSMFMHSDVSHLLGNMIFLWTFGRRVEDACGAWRYLLFYLAAGMVANIGSEVLNPAHADIPGIGASGAIAGVMGAYLILFPGARVQCLWIVGSILRIPVALLRGQPLWRWTLSLPAAFLLIYFAVSEALPSFEVIQRGSDVGGVNHLAHLTGFLAAILILLYVRKDLLTRFISGRSL
jgi:membrane associated rhomboid family serine protease